MAVTLLRHTTPDVAKGICYGRSDLALADSFEAEFAALHPGLPEVRTILTSPLGRCRILANRIAAALDLVAQPVADFVEMDFGRWEGVAWDAIPRDELDGWAADFMGYNDHGGESVAQLFARVAEGLNGLPPHTLVVCHAGVIKAALAARGVEGAWDHQTPFGGTVAL